MDYAVYTNLIDAIDDEIKLLITCIRHFFFSFVIERCCQCFTSGCYDAVLLLIQFFRNLGSQSGNDAVLERANSSTKLKIEISLKYI